MLFNWFVSASVWLYVCACLSAYVPIAHGVSIMRAFGSCMRFAEYVCPSPSRRIDHVLFVSESVGTYAYDLLSMYVFACVSMYVSLSCIYVHKYVYNVSGKKPIYIYIYVYIYI